VFFFFVILGSTKVKRERFFMREENGIKEEI